MVAVHSLVQRYHTDDAAEFVQHIGVMLCQVAQNGFVGHQFGEIALGQHQVEYVLAISLLSQLELLLEITHFSLHLGHLLGADSGDFLGLGLADEQVTGRGGDQGLGVGDRDVVGADHQFDAFDLSGWLELTQHRPQVG